MQDTERGYSRTKKLNPASRWGSFILLSGFVLELLCRETNEHLDMQAVYDSRQTRLRRAYPTLWRAGHPNMSRTPNYLARKIQYPCMQIDDSDNETKCWLTYPDEIDVLARQAREAGWTRRIAILLMGKVGLRASGVHTAKPQGLAYNEEGDFWQLTVKGKNTKGGEKATRDAYVPEGVKRELENYAKERDISPSEPYVDASVDSIRGGCERRENRLQRKMSGGNTSPHTTVAVAGPLIT